MAQILVVDDEMGIRELLYEILADEGHTVWLAENAASARSSRNERRPDLVLLDIWMPDTDGISLLKEWSAAGQLTMPVVMMSGHGTIDSAVEATRVGAIDFLEKPIALQKLLATVKKALKHEVAPQKPPLTLDAFARSPLLKDLKKRLEQAAAKNPVLLLRSASGSIAEICARTLQTPKMPWLDLSASSDPLTQEMLENAAGGILFVADLALLGKLQQKNLIYALERLEKYNLQLVAASTRALPALIEAGWDAAVMARLGEVWVTLPQLSGHGDEVPEIAALVLAHLVARSDVPPRQFSSGALTPCACTTGRANGRNCWRPSRIWRCRRSKTKYRSTTSTASCCATPAKRPRRRRRCRSSTSPCARRARPSSGFTSNITCAASAAT